MLGTPKQLDSLTSSWLSEVLAATVTNVEILDAHAGTTGRALLQLTYQESVALPERLFVKLPPTDEMQRAFVTSSGMGRRESRFYQTLSAEMPVRVPHCFYAASDPAGEEYIMLLENLVDSDCTFDNSRTRYSLQYVQQVLSAFAKLHAQYWASSRFDTDLNWLQPPLQHDIALQLVAQSLQMHGQSMPAAFRTMGELYLSEADAIHQLWQRGTPTVIHGDVHDANLFFDNGEPGFLDWALVARGPALRDVGYFLAGTLTPQDQAAAASDLLRYYRAQLQQQGVAVPPFSEMWQQYQWHAAYVWVGSAATLAMGDAWQPVSYVKSSLARLHAAMDSLGSIAAIQASL